MVSTWKKPNQVYPHVNTQFADDTTANLTMLCILLNLYEQGKVWTICISYQTSGNIQDAYRSTKE
jgi:hypothetical protein